MCEEAYVVHNGNTNPVINLNLHYQFQADLSLLQSRIHPFLQLSESHYVLI